MPRKKRPILKSIAAILVATFLATDLAYAYPSDGGVSGTVPWRGQSLSASESQTLLLKDPSRFEAPVEFSSLKEIHKGDDKTFIIHIQDAHANLSGQQNLANSLDQIMSRYKVSLVLVEGGSKDDTLTPIKEVAPPEVWKRVAKSFLMEGKISGEEYLNLISDHPMKIMGIEDRELYLKSVRAYGDLAERREAILEYLKRIDSGLEKLKRKLYPKELIEYEALGDRRQELGDSKIKKLLELAQLNTSTSQQLNNFPTLQKLSILLEQEKSIDFNLANLEQAALIQEIDKKGGGSELRDYLSRASKLNQNKLAQFSYFRNTLNIAKTKNIQLTQYPNYAAYGDYLEEFSKIDLEELIEESERLEDEVYKAVIASEAKQSQIASSPSAPRNDIALIHAIDRYIQLLQTAYHIQMTTKEFELFKVNEPDFLTAATLAFINRKLAELGYFTDLLPYENYLEEGKAALENFYASVAERDLSFMKNSERILKEENAQVAILIAGGYHTSHLTKLFKEKGYSYAVLAPTVTSETNQAKYERLLLEPVKKEIKIVSTSSESALEKDFIQLKKANDDVRTERIAEALDGARLAQLVGAAARIAHTEDKAAAMMLESAIGANRSASAKKSAGLSSAPLAPRGARLVAAQQILEAVFERQESKALSLLIQASDKVGVLNSMRDLWETTALGYEKLVGDSKEEFQVRADRFVDFLKIIVASEHPDFIPLRVLASQIVESIQKGQLYIDFNIALKKRKEEAYQIYLKKKSSRRGNDTVAAKVAAQYKLRKDINQLTKNGEQCPSAEEFDQFYQAITEPGDSKLVTDNLVMVFSIFAEKENTEGAGKFLDLLISRVDASEPLKVMGPMVVRDKADFVTGALEMIPPGGTEAGYLKKLFGSVNLVEIIQNSQTRYNGWIFGISLEQFRRSALVLIVELDYKNVSRDLEGMLGESIIGEFSNVRLEAHTARDINVVRDIINNFIDSRSLHLQSKSEELLDIKRRLIELVLLDRDLGSGARLAGKTNGGEWMRDGGKTATPQSPMAQPSVGARLADLALTPSTVPLERAYFSPTDAAVASEILDYLAGNPKIAQHFSTKDLAEDVNLTFASKKFSHTTRYAYIVKALQLAKSKGYVKLLEEGRGSMGRRYYEWTGSWIVGTKLQGTIESGGRRKRLPKTAITWEEKRILAIKKSLAEQFLKMREKMKLTQAEAGKVIGKSRTVVAMIEGQPQEFSISYLRRVLNELNPNLKIKMPRMPKVKGRLTGREKKRLGFFIESTRRSLGITQKIAEQALNLPPGTFTSMEKHAYQHSTTELREVMARFQNPRVVARLQELKDAAEIERVLEELKGLSITPILNDEAKAIVRSFLEGKEKGRFDALAERLARANQMGSSLEEAERLLVAALVGVEEGLNKESISEFISKHQPWITAQIRVSASAKGWGIERDLVANVLKKIRRYYAKATPYGARLATASSKWEHRLSSYSFPIINSTEETTETGDLRKDLPAVVTALGNDPKNLVYLRRLAAKVNRALRRIPAGERELIRTNRGVQLPEYLHETDFTAEVYPADFTNLFRDARINLASLLASIRDRDFNLSSEASAQILIHSYGHVVESNGGIVWNETAVGVTEKAALKLQREQLVEKFGLDKTKPTHEDQDPMYWLGRAESDLLAEVYRNQVQPNGSFKTAFARERYPRFFVSSENWKQHLNTEMGIIAFAQHMVMFEKTGSLRLAQAAIEKLIAPLPFPNRNLFVETYQYLSNYFDSHHYDPNWVKKFKGARLAKFKLTSRRRFLANAAKLLAGGAFASCFAAIPEKVPDESVADKKFQQFMKSLSQKPLLKGYRPSTEGGLDNSNKILGELVPLRKKLQDPNLTEPQLREQCLQTYRKIINLFPDEFKAGLDMRLADDAAIDQFYVRLRDYFGFNGMVVFYEGRSKKMPYYFIPALAFIVVDVEKNTGVPVVVSIGKDRSFEEHRGLGFTLNGTPMIASAAIQEEKKSLENLRAETMKDKITFGKALSYESEREGKRVQSLFQDDVLEGSDYLFRRLISLMPKDVEGEILKDGGYHEEQHQRDYGLNLDKKTLELRARIKSLRHAPWHRMLSLAIHHKYSGNTGDVLVNQIEQEIKEAIVKIILDDPKSYQALIELSIPDIPSSVSQQSIVTAQLYKFVLPENKNKLEALTQKLAEHYGFTDLFPKPSGARLAENPNRRLFLKNVLGAAFLAASAGDLATQEQPTAKTQEKPWQDFKDTQSFEGIKECLLQTLEWMKKSNYPFPAVLDAYAEALKNATPIMGDLERAPILTKMLLTKDRPLISINVKTLSGILTAVKGGGDKSAELFLENVVSMLGREAWGLAYLKESSEEGDELSILRKNIAKSLEEFNYDADKTLAKHDQDIEKLAAFTIAGEAFEVYRQLEVADWARAVFSIPAPKIRADDPNKTWLQELESRRSSLESILEYELSLWLPPSLSNYFVAGGFNPQSARTPISQFAYDSFVVSEMQKGKKGFEAAVIRSYFEKNGRVPKELFRNSAKRLAPLVERIVKKYEKRIKEAYPSKPTGKAGARLAEYKNPPWLPNREVLEKLAASRHIAVVVDPKPEDIFTRKWIQFDQDLDVTVPVGSQAFSNKDVQRWSMLNNLSVTQIFKEMQLPETTTGLVVLYTSDLVSSKKPVSFERILLEEILHVISDDERPVQHDVHINLAMEAVTNFFILMFYPEDKVSEFYSPHVDWSDDEKRALIARYFVQKGNSPDFQAILSRLAADIPKNVSIPVGEGHQNIQSILLGGFADDEGYQNHLKACVAYLVKTHAFAGLTISTERNFGARLAAQPFTSDPTLLSLKLKAYQEWIDAFLSDYAERYPELEFHALAEAFKELVQRPIHEDDWEARYVDAVGKHFSEARPSIDNDTLKYALRTLVNKSKNEDFSPEDIEALVEYIKSAHPVEKKQNESKSGKKQIEISLVKQDDEETEELMSEFGNEFEVYLAVGLSKETRADFERMFSPSADDEAVQYGILSANGKIVSLLRIGYRNGIIPTLHNMPLKKLTFELWSLTRQRTANPSDFLDLPLVGNQWIHRVEKINDGDSLSRIRMTYEVPKGTRLAQRPWLSNLFDLEKLRRWVNAHPRKWRPLIRLIAKNIHHVSQEKFEEALQEAVDDFKSKFSGSYLMMNLEMSQPDSVEWVRSLVLEKGLPAPVNPDLSQSMIEALRANPEVLDVVIADDASYTGDALGSYILRIQEHFPERKLRFHVLVPFMTRASVSTVKKKVSERTPSKIYFYKHRQIETLEEILKKASPKYIQMAKELYAGHHSDLNFDDYNFEHDKVRTLTYFDHKVPDTLSFFKHILDGWVLGLNGRFQVSKGRFSLIPKTVEPYHPDYQEWAKRQIRHGRRRTSGVPVAAGARLSALKNFSVVLSIALALVTGNYFIERHLFKAFPEITVAVDEKDEADRASIERYYQEFFKSYPETKYKIWINHPQEELKQPSTFLSPTIHYVSNKNIIALGLSAFVFVPLLCLYLLSNLSKKSKGDKGYFFNETISVFSVITFFAVALNTADMVRFRAVFDYFWYFSALSPGDFIFLSSIGFLFGRLVYGALNSTPHRGARLAKDSKNKKPEIGRRRLLQTGLILGGGLLLVGGTAITRLLNAKRQTQNQAPVQARPRKLTDEEWFGELVKTTREIHQGYKAIAENKKYFESTNSFIGRDLVSGRDVYMLNENHFETYSLELAVSFLRDRLPDFRKNPKKWLFIDENLLLREATMKRDGKGLGNPHDLLIRTSEHFNIPRIGPIKTVAQWEVIQEAIQRGKGYALNPYSPEEVIAMAVTLFALAQYRPDIADEVVGIKTDRLLSDWKKEASGYAFNREKIIEIAKELLARKTAPSPDRERPVFTVRDRELESLIRRVADEKTEEAVTKVIKDNPGVEKIFVILGRNHSLSVLNGIEKASLRPGKGARLADANTYKDSLRKSLVVAGIIGIASCAVMTLSFLGPSILVSYLPTVLKFWLIISAAIFASRFQGHVWKQIGIMALPIVWIGLLGGHPVGLKQVLFTIGGVLATFAGTLLSKGYISKASSQSPKEIFYSSLRWSLIVTTISRFMLYTAFMPFILGTSVSGAFLRTIFDQGIASTFAHVPSTMMLGMIFGEKINVWKDITKGNFGDLWRSNTVKAILRLYPINFLFWYVALTINYSLAGNNEILFFTNQTFIHFVWVGFLERHIRRNFEASGARLSTRRDGSEVIDGAGDLSRLRLVEPTTVLKGFYSPRTGSSVIFRKGMKIKPGSEVLILGGGTGADAILAASLGAKKVYVTDLNTANIELNVSQSKFRDRIVVLKGDLFNIAELKGKKFDHIFMNSWIEDKLVYRLLSEANTYLKEGGTLGLTYAAHPLFLSQIYEFGWKPQSVFGFNKARKAQEAPKLVMAMEPAAPMDVLDVAGEALSNFTGLEQKDYDYGFFTLIRRAPEDFERARRYQQDYFDLHLSIGTNGDASFVYGDVQDRVMNEYPSLTYLDPTDNSKSLGDRLLFLTARNTKAAAESSSRLEVSDEMFEPPAAGARLASSTKEGIRKRVWVPTLAALLMLIPLVQSRKGASKSSEENGVAQTQTQKKKVSEVSWSEPGNIFQKTSSRRQRPFSVNREPVDLVALNKAQIEYTVEELNKSSYRGWTASQEYGDLNGAIAESMEGMRLRGELARLYAIETYSFYSRAQDVKGFYDSRTGVYSATFDNQTYYFADDGQATHILTPLTPEQVQIIYEDWRTQQIIENQDGSLTVPGLKRIQKELIPINPPDAAARLAAKKKGLSLDEASVLLRGLHQVANLSGEELEKDLGWSELLAAELTRHPIDKMVVVGDGLRTLPLFLALMGKEVLFVDKNDEKTYAIEEAVLLLNRKVNFKLRVKTVTSEIGVLNLSEHGLSPHSYDAMTFAGLMGGAPEGDPGKWLKKASELLKSKAYLVIDETNLGKNSLIDNFPGSFTDPQLLAAGRFFHDGYNKLDRIPNRLYAVNNPAATGARLADSQVAVGTYFARIQAGDEKVFEELTEVFSEEEIHIAIQVLEKCIFELDEVAQGRMIHLAFKALKGIRRDNKKTSIQGKAAGEIVMGIYEKALLKLPDSVEESLKSDLINDNLFPLFIDETEFVPMSLVSAVGHVLEVGGKWPKRHAFRALQTLALNLKANEAIRQEAHQILEKFIFEEFEKQNFDDEIARVKERYRDHLVGVGMSLENIPQAVMSAMNLERQKTGEIFFKNGRPDIPETQNPKLAMNVSQGHQEIMDALVSAGSDNLTHCHIILIRNKTNQRQAFLHVWEGIKHALGTYHIDFILEALGEGEKEAVYIKSTAAENEDIISGSESYLKRKGITTNRIIPFYQPKLLTWGVVYRPATNQVVIYQGGEKPKAYLLEAFTQGSRLGSIQQAWNWFKGMPGWFKWFAAINVAAFLGYAIAAFWLFDSNSPVKQAVTTVAQTNAPPAPVSQITISNLTNIPSKSTSSFQQITNRAYTAIDRYRILFDLYGTNLFAPSEKEDVVALWTSIAFFETSIHHRQQLGGGPAMISDVQIEPEQAKTILNRALTAYRGSAQEIVLLKGLSLQMQKEIRSLADRIEQERGQQGKNKSYKDASLVTDLKKMLESPDMIARLTILNIYQGLFQNKLTLPKADDYKTIAQVYKQIWRPGESIQDRLILKAWFVHKIFREGFEWKDLQNHFDFYLELDAIYADLQSARNRMRGRNPDGEAAVKLISSAQKRKATLEKKIKEGRFNTISQDERKLLLEAVQLNISGFQGSLADGKIPRGARLTMRHSLEALREQSHTQAAEVWQAQLKRIGQHHPKSSIRRIFIFEPHKIKKEMLKQTVEALQSKVAKIYTFDQSRRAPYRHRWVLVNPTLKKQTISSEKSAVDLLIVDASSISDAGVKRAKGILRAKSQSHRLVVLCMAEHESDTDVFIRRFQTQINPETLDHDFLFLASQARLVERFDDMFKILNPQKGARLAWADLKEMGIALSHGLRIHDSMIRREFIQPAVQKLSLDTDDLRAFYDQAPLSSDERHDLGYLLNQLHVIVSFDTGMGAPGFGETSDFREWSRQHAHTVHDGDYYHAERAGLVLFYSQEAPSTFIASVLKKFDEIDHSELSPRKKISSKLGLLSVVNFNAKTLRVFTTSALFKELNQKISVILTDALATGHFDGTTFHGFAELNKALTKGWYSPEWIRSDKDVQTVRDFLRKQLLPQKAKEIGLFLDRAPAANKDENAEALLAAAAFAEISWDELQIEIDDPTYLNIFHRLMEGLNRKKPYQYHDVRTRLFAALALAGLIEHRASKSQRHDFLNAVIRELGRSTGSDNYKIFLALTLTLLHGSFDSLDDESRHQMQNILSKKGLKSSDKTIAALAASGLVTLRFGAYGARLSKGDDTDVQALLDFSVNNPVEFNIALDANEWIQVKVEAIKPGQFSVAFTFMLKGVPEFEPQTIRVMGRSESETPRAVALELLDLKSRHTLRWVSLEAKNKVPMATLNFLEQGLSRKVGARLAGNILLSLRDQVQQLKRNIASSAVKSREINRVLIIADNPVRQKMFKDQFEFLGRSGIEFYTPQGSQAAQDGFDAYEAANRTGKFFDVIIIDDQTSLATSLIKSFSVLEQDNPNPSFIILISENISEATETSRISVDLLSPYFFSAANPQDPSFRDFIATVNSGARLAKKTPDLRSETYVGGSIFIENIGGKPGIGIKASIRIPSISQKAESPRFLERFGARLTTTAFAAEDVSGIARESKLLLAKALLANGLRNIPINLTIKGSEKIAVIGGDISRTKTGEKEGVVRFYGPNELDKFGVEPFAILKIEPALMEEAHLSHAALSVKTRQIEATPALEYFTSVMQARRWHEKVRVDTRSNLVIAVPLSEDATISAQEKQITAQIFKALQPIFKCNVSLVYTKERVFNGEALNLVDGVAPTGDFRVIVLAHPGRTQILKNIDGRAGFFPMPEVKANGELIEAGPYAAAFMLADLAAPNMEEGAGARLAANDFFQQLLRMAIGSKYIQITDRAEVISAMLRADKTKETLYFKILFEPLQPIRFKHILEAVQMVIEAIGTAA